MLWISIKNIPTSPFKTWLMVQVIKEDMERTLKNTNMKPLSHSSYLRLQVLLQCFWDVEEKLCLLNNLSFADLATFIPDLLSQVWFKFPFPPFSWFLLLVRLFMNLETEYYLGIRLHGNCSLLGHMGSSFLSFLHCFWVTCTILCVYSHSVMHNIYSKNFMESWWGVLRFYFRWRLLAIFFIFSRRCCNIKL